MFHPTAPATPVATHTYPTTHSQTPTHPHATARTPPVGQSATLESMPWSCSKVLIVAFLAQGAVRAAAFAQAVRAEPGRLARFNRHFSPGDSLAGAQGPARVGPPGRQA